MQRSFLIISVFWLVNCLAAGWYSRLAINYGDGSLNPHLLLSTCWSVFDTDEQARACSVTALLSVHIMSDKSYKNSSVFQINVCFYSRFKLSHLSLFCISPNIVSFTHTYIRMIVENSSSLPSSACIGVLLMSALITQRLVWRPRASCTTSWGGLQGIHLDHIHRGERVFHLACLTSSGPGATTLLGGQCPWGRPMPPTSLPRKQCPGKIGQYTLSYTHYINDILLKWLYITFYRLFYSVHCISSKEAARAH